jgi:hypothetical protein
MSLQLLLKRTNLKIFMKMRFRSPFLISFMAIVPSYLEESTVRRF